MGPGFSKKEYGLIKLSQLNQMDEGSTVDYDILKKAKAVHKTKYKLKKVVSSHEPLTVKGLNVKAHAFTKSARAAIEDLGGTCVVLSPTTHRPLGEKRGEDDPKAD